MYLQRIKRKICRILISISSDPRPASYPYISGDGFRKLAKHVHDETGTFDPSLVERGDIVFVKADFVDNYFSNIHQRIANPYVLITHNSDKDIGASEARYADDSKIIKWFAQNTLVHHPKIVPIPIGLENAHYAHAGRKADFDRVRAQKSKRNGRILASFTVNTNPQERSLILSAIKNNPLVDIPAKALFQNVYLKTLASYDAVVSPPGNGEDCHRTWEALYVGTTPLVAPSAGTDHFKSIGMPIQIVSDWNSISTFDKASVIPAVSSDSPIFFEYWKELIIKSTK